MTGVTAISHDGTDKLTMPPEKDAVLDALRQTIDEPTLANARALESILRGVGTPSRVFGRLNQKSSIYAAGESDRGITERIANAFDASVTAARRLSGMYASDASLTPRNAAQRFLNSDRDACEWRPAEGSVDFGKPCIQFWPEDEGVDLRYLKYKSREGLVTVLVRDTALGISRDRMSATILDLNSDDKLKTFEAIGQFGHGGSSALAFCELCLVVSQPRFDNGNREFFWTLIFPEPEGEASKQSIVRKWFADADGFPLSAPTQAFPSLALALPGTSIWHFGYNRGDWLKTAVGIHQNTPAGRFGRLFFSYPLPFEIRGEFARGDTPSGIRTVKGAYFRLLDDKKSKGEEVVEYRSGEKSETLIVDGQSYGQFSVFVFVLRDRGTVRNYVEKSHPVVITLNGQNHGEMTPHILADSNLPELATSSIVEVRLDGLEEEALSNIISNSRETPKNTPFTRVLRERVIRLLEADEGLAEIERLRHEEKAKQSSQELNKKITRFLSSILSDAAAEPSEKSGGNAPGKRGGGGGGKPRPEVPAGDPPKILEFISDAALFIPEGTAKLARFKSDARLPRYSFHGDSPRCFARVDLNDGVQDQVTIVGRADVDGRGYGSVTLSCAERPKSPVNEPKAIGVLALSIQCTDGRLLNAQVPIGIKPKPTERQKKRTQAVQPEIIFCAPDGHDREALAEALAEDRVGPFGYLEKYRDALSVKDLDCAYWGEGSQRDGSSVLTVEINITHPQFQALIKACSTPDELMQAKERVVQDIVLDCYQHCFRLDDVPEIVHDQVLREPEDLKRAAEICLNYDKALRMAMLERKVLAKTR